MSLQLKETILASFNISLCYVLLNKCILAIYFCITIFSFSGCSDDRLVSAKYAEKYILYVSPDGDDSASGSIDLPLATFEGVQEKLKKDTPGKDVLVKIFGNRGSYINHTTVWNYYNPNYKITFESYPRNVRAHFSASDENPPEEPFFKVIASSGQPTNLVFRRLTISDYTSRALYFLGCKESAQYGWNGRNIIEDCVFRKIGNSRKPERAFVYAVITMVNSRENIIRNCVIEDCANSNPYGNKALLDEKGSDKISGRDIEGSPSILTIIGIYLAHYSSNNHISNNIFRGIMGDCIRFRDLSCENSVFNNTFSKSGWEAVCTTWHCSYLSGICSKAIPECSSWENVFFDNIIYGSWSCDSIPLAYKDLSPSKMNDACCSIPAEYESKVKLINNSIFECKY